MNVGLSKFLQRIGAEPTNRVLIKRYLALLDEMPLQSERNDYRLKLAAALCEKEPTEALEHAYRVFKEEQTNLLALTLIAQALRNLGKLGKAEVIENEIAKLRALENQAQRGPPAFDAGRVNYTRIDQIVNVREGAKTVPPLEEASPPPAAPPFIPKAPEQPPPPRATAPITENLPTTAESPLTRELRPAFDQDDYTIPPRPAPVEEVQRQEHEPDPRETVMSVPEKIVPPPRPPEPPPRESPTTTMIMEKPREYFVLKTEVRPSAEPPQREVPTADPRADFDPRRRMTTDQTRTSSTSSSTAPPPQSFETPPTTYQLSDDPQDLDTYNAINWGRELDLWIAEERYRKALNQIITQVGSHKSLAWAKQGWLRLASIWDRLGLVGFSWDPAEGVNGLHKKLLKRNPPKLSMIAGSYSRRQVPERGRR